MRSDALPATGAAAAPWRAGLSPLPGSGMPHERLARIAARRSFVEMKRICMAAAELLDEDALGVWLRRQARLAQAPEDLWWLRGQLIDAARTDDHLLASVRVMLHGCPGPSPFETR
jgi:hypothetical protein